MKLNKLSARDKTIFNRYLSLKKHGLSNYAFENIFIWKGLFEIRWAVIKKSLCVFFEDNFGLFLYLPPLSKRNDPGVIREVFTLMHSANKNKEVSRIENVEDGDVSLYEKLNLECRRKSWDYICLSSQIAQLKGNRFKSQRASLNYFLKNHTPQYLPYSGREKEECLNLYDNWMGRRKAKYKDSLYQGMLSDSRSTLKLALDNLKDLNLACRIIRVKGKLIAFSAGYELNKESFCILYEIADLDFKGLAQFIFSKFCAELSKKYTYVNIMDDSGLENLKAVKLSYHPVRLEPAYIVREGSGTVLL
ncbi:MAG: phosphatidylglycerol lysyltransferase domain-containing protein [Candidatus Omnitrophota bacterium]